MVLPVILINVWRGENLQDHLQHVDMSCEQQVNSGVVVATGPGAKTKDGTVIPCDVKSGDTVLLPEYGGTPVKLEGQEGKE